MSKIGEIYWAFVSYTDLKENKKRPIVIINIDKEDIIYIPLTTNLTQKGILFTMEDIEDGYIENSMAVIKKQCILHNKRLYKYQAKLNKNALNKLMKAISFAQIGDYYNIFHKSFQHSPFIKGKSKINYAGRVFDEKEIINLVDSALDFWLTSGKFDKKFCEKFSEFLKVKHVITCNSGSSANLLAISALTSYKLKDLRLKPGDEVITVAAGFPTTIAPIIQDNLTPVFVDIELGSYNINPDLIEEAISSNTKAIFLAHTLGFPFNLDRVLEVAEKYNLWVIEDNCDALGARYNLQREYKLINNKKISGKNYTGTFGHIGTSSFYPPHHITMGEGGAVYTNNTMLYRILLSFRDWGRDCWCETGKDNSCNKRFSWKLGNLPEGYDHKYIYSHLGYNLKITDMQAAIGVSQLAKLDDFITIRQKNWQKLYNGLKEFEEFFILPEIPNNSTPSPFGFVITIRDNAPFTRKQIISYLEDKKIQTRMIFAGNIIKQPALTEAKYNYRSPGELKNTDKVMHDTFWLGVYPGLSDEMIDYIIEQIKNFIKKNK